MVKEGVKLTSTDCGLAIGLICKLAREPGVTVICTWLLVSVPQANVETQTI